MQLKYYEGLEDVVIPWCDQEADVRVKELIAEHIARFAGECGPYEDKTWQLLEAEPRLQSRILVGAEGKKLYSDIRARESGFGTGDLFADERDPLVTAIRRAPKSKRVLFLGSAPRDQGRLRLDKEVGQITEKVRTLADWQNKISFETRWAIQKNQIQDAVLSEKPQIVHFSGHGDSGELLFEDSHRDSAPVRADAIANLLRVARTVECLVLNACYSRSVGRKCKPYVDVVVGCSGSIDDEAAIIFSRTFYHSIAQGLNYQVAFDLAVSEVRLNIGGREAKKFQIEV